MGFLGNFFKSFEDDEGKNVFGATANREILKNNLAASLMQRGFTQMEVTEIMDVITLAEADIQIAADSLAHVNVNNPDPTRAIHAAVEDMKRYEKELNYNLRMKILEILNRKNSMNR